MKQYLLRLFCLLLVPLDAFGQGPLEPSGPPAPTMTTLEQVEPRKPIDPRHTPGDATADYIISAPGSYYLTGNLALEKTTGIRVTVADATIDLNGFQLSRKNGAAGGTGINVQANSVTVKNGSILGFTNGIYSLGGTGTFLQLTFRSCESTGLSTGGGSRVEGVTVIGVNGDGINVGRASALINCVVRNGIGGGGVAIQAGSGSTLLNCAAEGNNAKYGIEAGDGSTLTNCAATNNTSNEAVSAGIATGLYSTIIGCAAESNKNTNATPSGTTGAGIIALHGSVIRNCSAGSNKGDGIRVENACTVSDCVSSGNGFQTGVGVGIRSTGHNIRIQNNNVTSNDAGIRVEGTGNLIDGNHVRNHTGPGIQVTTANGKNVIIRNIAGENVNSYSSIATGNQTGPIDTNFTATSPFANFGN